jgi:hypothetical protein
MESRIYRPRHYQARTVSDITAPGRTNICDAVPAFNIEDVDMANALWGLELPFIFCYHIKH